MTDKDIRTTTVFIALYSCNKAYVLHQC